MFSRIGFCALLVTLTAAREVPANLQKYYDQHKVTNIATLSISLIGQFYPRMLLAEMYWRALSHQAREEGTRSTAGTRQAVLSF